jgi:phospholipid/cholesterol/gamma-HCH transport system ATP-binding protein
MESDLLKLENISIRFGNETILDNISMNFQRGRLIAITGPSGCGKSTLLKISAGLIYPDTGKVFINGVDILNVSRPVLFQMRREFAFVFQDSALLSNLTVYNNIALPLRYHYNPPEEEVDKKVTEMLRTFDLEDDKNNFPAQLSMGQRKLASFARGLIMEPTLIFFDEPVAGIDAIAREKMVNKILPLRDNPEITLIMVSHNLDFIKSSADYIALIYDNRLFSYGSRDEILKSRDPIIQRILSIIIDEEAAVAEEVLGILTGK